MEGGSFRLCKPSLVLRLPNFSHAARTRLNRQQPPALKLWPSLSRFRKKNSAAQSDDDKGLFTALTIFDTARLYSDPESLLLSPNRSAKDRRLTDQHFHCPNSLEYCQSVPRIPAVYVSRWWDVRKWPRRDRKMRRKARVHRSNSPPVATAGCPTPVSVHLH